MIIQINQLILLFLILDLTTYYIIFFTDIMEYVEPLDDLLGGSDDEQESQDGLPSSGLLDLDDLMTTDEDKSKSSSSNMNPIFLDMDINIEDDSDDEAEDDRDKENEKRKESNLESITKRENIIKMLSLAAPGLNLFPGKKEESENKFLFFNLETLNLEKDCEYTRRGKLLGHGFTNERLDNIFKSRFEFVRHLFPEAQSVLLCDKNDFKSIMNFLFYSISVCTDITLNDLMTKAFFDLRRNYGFRWDLNLKLIRTVLTNYGISEDAVFNENFYNRKDVGIQQHLEQVKKSGQNTELKYKLPRLPQFVQKTSSNNTLTGVKSEEFNFCLSRIIEVICQFISGFPSHLDFKYKSNWANQTVLVHILLLLGTDKRLIMDVNTKENIRLAIYFLLDSFSTELWHWGPACTASKQDKANSEKFNNFNVHKNIVRLVHEFFPGDFCPEVITWTENENSNRLTDIDKKSDHHLNMIHRLQLIPPSFRGNQLRKYLAFMYLQTLGNAADNGYRLPTSVDVIELTENLGNSLNVKFWCYLKAIILCL